MADTPKSYFEEKIAAKLTAKPDLSKAVNATYEFNITGDNGGVWTVDLTKEPGVVSAGSGGAAKCIVTCASNHFMDIVSGKMNAQMAFMSGKLKVKGDMGLAMKLQKVIG
ncbi:MAG: SCP2 sterol-binding domain-containing protein [Deltaproteobacteria bacterium]|nr:SCP2 sterol-binding domain-containing protein [Deltaproteobacteria bacterium]